MYSAGNAKCTVCDVRSLRSDFLAQSVLVSGLVTRARESVIGKLILCWEASSHASIVVVASS